MKPIKTPKCPDCGSKNTDLRALRQEAYFFDRIQNLLADYPNGGKR